MTVNNRPIETIQKSKLKKLTSFRALFLFLLMIILIITGSLILQKDQQASKAYKELYVEELYGIQTQADDAPSVILAGVEDYTSPGRLADKQLIYLAVLVIGKEQVDILPLEVFHPSNSAYATFYKTDISEHLEDLEKQLELTIDAVVHIDFSELRNFVEKVTYIPAKLTYPYEHADLELKAAEEIHLTPRQAEILSYPLPNEDITYYHERIRNLLAGGWDRVDGPEDILAINQYIAWASELLQTNVPYTTFRKFYIKRLFMDFPIHIHETQALDWSH